MRVVSPVAISALAAISAQNFMDGMLQQALLSAEAMPSPNHHDLASAEKAVKPHPIQPSAAPETLTLHQFTGVAAPLNLAVPLQPESIAPLVSRSATLSTLAPAQAAEGWTQRSLPPLDPVVDQVIQAEMQMLYQANPAVARGFNLPPEVTRRLAQIATPPASAVAFDASEVAPSTLSEPTPTVPVARSREADAIAEKPATAIGQSAVSDVPDYLLPQRAAAVGFDRIQPELAQPLPPVREIDPATEEAATAAASLQRFTAAALRPADVELARSLKLTEPQATEDSVLAVQATNLLAIAPPAALEAEIPTFSAPAASASSLVDPAIGSFLPAASNVDQLNADAATVNAELSPPLPRQIPAPTSDPTAAVAQTQTSTVNQTIRVSVVGAIASPVELELPAQTSLHQAISRVGGFVNSSSQHTAELIRRHLDGSVSWRSIKLDEADVGSSTNLDDITNPMLQHNDVIVVD